MIRLAFIKFPLATKSTNWFGERGKGVERRNLKARSLERLFHSCGRMVSFQSDANEV